MHLICRKSKNDSFLPRGEKHPFFNFALGGKNDFAFVTYLILRECADI